MTFIVLTFLAAFLIEGLGTVVSVIGLSTLFGANPIIIALAVALDIGKLIVVTLLYTYWKHLSKLMKAYALVASIITMTITSAGSAGYLSAKFQEAIIGTQEGSLKVNVLKDEQARLQKRKEQIDQQIASLPEKFSATQRIRMINQFKDEQKQVTARLSEIDRQLPDLQVKQINVEAKAGPILYIAKAFDVPVEVAVKYVILMIIFVFDPLAVFLIIAGNFLLHQRKLHKDTGVGEADLFEEGPPRITNLAPPPREAVTKQYVDNLDSPINAPIGSKEWEDAVDALPEPTTIPPMPPVPAPRPEPVVEEPLMAEEPSEVIASDIKFRDPDAERDIITLSSLRDVVPDANTTVGGPTDNGALTPHSRPDIFKA